MFFFPQMRSAVVREALQKACVCECVSENDASGKFCFNFRPGQYLCVFNDDFVPMLMCSVGSVSPVISAL